ncbi:SNARE domain protein [Teladorsagia circumcincta]|uniref:SNARE domain protein n=1 Tax=Teladorsagia circumcincta TaxID=45464 RepID=A0A2G9UY78_TELCI|nr:SNARE domain protein [Teladorsagia circumcincta]
MDFDSNDGTIIRKLQENIEELGQQVQHLDSFISRLTESEQHREQFNEIRDAAEQDAEAASRRIEEDAYDRERQFQRQRQQQLNLNEFKERQQALQQLEQDIGDVNQIFADLARIVHDQGDMVDSIEANVEHAQIHVEQTKKAPYLFR